MKFYIKIADQIFNINSVYNDFYNWCGNYVYENVSSSEAAIINSSKEHIQNLAIKLAIEDRKKGIYLKRYNAVEIEKLVFLEQISNYMIDFSTFLIHGSVIATDMKHCYMFTASSGTGKTTHTKLWLDNLPNSFVVNGDKPFFKIDSEKVLAYGTPWCGKEGWNTNCMVPLKGIVILERAEENNIQEVSFEEAFPTLLQQTHRPTDVHKMMKVLTLLSLLKNKVKFYKMQVNNFKEDAFKTSYNMITEEIQYR